MQRQQLIVDGKDFGKFPKSDKIKKLAMLKGVEVRTVEETDRERALRLQKQRDHRQQSKMIQAAAEQAQPSLIDGVPTVQAYSKKAAV